jgi:hypothetical protein
LLGRGLQAQNIAGNWQGILQAGPQKVRIVFKIALEGGQRHPNRAGRAFKLLLLETASSRRKCLRSPCLGR